MPRFSRDQAPFVATPLDRDEWPDEYGDKVEAARLDAVEHATDLADATKAPERLDKLIARKRDELASERRTLDVDRDDEHRPGVDDLLVLSPAQQAAVLFGAVESRMDEYVRLIRQAEMTTRRRPSPLIAAFQVTVGTTAVRLVNKDPDRNAVRLSIVPDEAGAVFVGPSSGVTATSGWPLEQAPFASTELPYSGELWAITATGTVRVAVLPLMD